MTLTHDSATLVTFTLAGVPAAAQAEPRQRATLHATQPCGYRQEVCAMAVRTHAGVVSATFRYPMIDDGRYDAPAGVARPKAWVMGEYRFRVILTHGNAAIAEETLVVDPHDYFPRNHKDIMAIDASTQCISCAPRQSLYVDEREAQIVLSIRRHRVSIAHVAVDVTAPQGERPLGGPWRFTVDDRPLEHRFSIEGWDDGEYWVRVRMLEGGERDRRLLRAQVLGAAADRARADADAGARRRPGGAGRRLRLRGGGGYAVPARGDR